MDRTDSDRPFAVISVWEIKMRVSFECQESLLRRGVESAVREERRASLSPL